MEASSLKPAISVVCPCYNSAAFVCKALESVVSQTYSPVELIVVDDGSSDNTVETALQYLKNNSGISFRIISKPHRGPGAARNEGIMNARGDWVSFIDSDDIWFPEKLAAVAQAIETHLDANFFCHNVVMIQLNGERVQIDYAAMVDLGKPLGVQLYKRNFFATSTVTCQRNMLLQMGMFDETLLSGQDFDLWLRMAPKLKPHFIPEDLSYYRQRPGSLTFRVWQRWKGAACISIRHRHYANLAGLIYRLLRVTGYYGFRSVANLNRKLF